MPICRERLLLQFLCLLGCAFLVFGYGEPTNGSPSWQERTSMALLNAARISPSAYATNYMGGFFASTSGAMTRVSAGLPVIISSGLTLAAEAHSKDITNNCPSTLQNNGCDGTPWSKSVANYWTCPSGSWSLGQIMFGGSVDPLYTMNYMLCSPKASADGKSYTCCADSDTSCNSLRNYAFSTSWTMGGNGFAGTVWTWDFSTCSQTINGIVTGSHVFMSNNNVRYIAQWRDTSGQTPASALVNLYSNGGWTAQPLTLDGGSPSLGNYAYQATPSTSCQYYYFTFVSNNATYRYPDTGFFGTFDGKSCTIDYSATNPTTTAIVPSAPSNLKSGVVTATSIGIMWTASADGGSAITNYQVSFQVSGTSSPNTTVVDGSTTSLTLAGLNASTTYVITVAAVNGIGTGPSSNIAVATVSSGTSDACGDATCLPASFNSRTATSCQGPGIYNQQNCGSCFAFATVAAASDRACLFAGGTTVISPQDILDCGYGSPYNALAGEGGCNGGYMFQAGQLMCARGLASASTVNLTAGCRPYKCGNGCDSSTIPACSTTCDDGSAYTTTSCTSYYQLPTDNSEVQLDIYNHGPVVTGIYVCQSFYDWFDTNVGSATYPYDCSPSSTDYAGGHAITVVGWWVDGNGNNAWICANSWGASWGGWNGYFSLPWNLNGLNDFGFVAASHGWEAPRNSRVPPGPGPDPPGGPSPCEAGNFFAIGGAIQGLNNWWFGGLKGGKGPRHNSDQDLLDDVAAPLNHNYEIRQAVTPMGQLVSTANPYYVTAIDGATTQVIAGQKVTMTVTASDGTSTVNLHVDIVRSVSGVMTVSAASTAGAGAAGSSALSTGALIGIIVGSVVGGILLMTLAVLLVVAGVYYLASRERSDSVDQVADEQIEMEPVQRRGTFSGLPKWYLGGRDRHNSITARSPPSQRITKVQVSADAV
eukprot:TRINITY_DN509_c0_g1_i1.p1 TRINITY_DN509_c0_g1~~TRINITY_DN509_c0_g1_i1.p1  ORF type:complete len:931 (-),score=48.09 TRINITY_DN509_c0_g1_i1:106-2898(-)